MDDIYNFDQKFARERIRGNFKEYFDASAYYSFPIKVLCLKCNQFAAGYRDINHLKDCEEANKIVEQYKEWKKMKEPDNNVHTMSFVELEKIYLYRKTNEENNRAENEVKQFKERYRPLAYKIRLNPLGYGEVIYCYDAAGNQQEFKDFDICGGARIFANRHFTDLLDLSKVKD